MSKYSEYIQEIDQRKIQGLNPTPIDSDVLTAEIIAQIKDVGNACREDSLHYLIYNTLPGTTSAASEKAGFLEEIILGDVEVDEISQSWAI